MGMDARGERDDDSPRRVSVEWLLAQAVDSDPWLDGNTGQAKKHARLMFS
jgi:hypothetical protein